MPRILSLCLFVWFASLSIAPAAPLSVGDPAPELKTGKWLKGEPVARLEPEKTYVVEFWATWCGPCRSSIPHLTELARRHSAATFIGLNVWERGTNAEATVAAFVEKMGDQMDYAVARDTDDQFMAKNWMDAAGRRGIPAAFIVHQGKIAWIGHPMSMDDPLAAILEGTYDSAEAAAPVGPPGRRAGVTPEMTQAIARYFAAVSKAERPEQTDALAAEIEKLDIQDPDLLNEVSWHILTSSAVTHRDLPLATRLAHKALDATREQRGDILDTYARALWDSGQTAEAIVYQNKAVAASPVDPSLVATLDRYLDRAGPGGPALALATERFGAAAVTVGDVVYVLAGHSDRGLVGTIEKFAAGSQATEPLAAAIVARRFFAAAAYGDKIVLAGGDVLQSSAGQLDAPAALFEEFDPATGQLRQLPDLPVAVSRPGAVLAGDRLYVVGGETADQSRSKAVQIFDFKTGTWSRGADAPAAREGHVFAHAGKIYVPGGFDGTVALDDFNVYDPEQDAWSALPELPVAASAFNGAVVDDQLYLFGDYAELARVAVYDFKTREWATLDIGYRPARHAAATQLGDTVFVVGGNVQPGPPYLARIQAFSSKQLADAPRRAWKPGAKPEAASAEARALATRLQGGRPGPSRSCCGGSAGRAIRAEPDPRFFRPKWKQASSGTAGQTRPGRGEWLVPPRHFVLVDADNAYVHRASDGVRVHTIPLPEPARKSTNDCGDRNYDFLFLQEGAAGVLVGSRDRYEIISRTSNSTSMRGIGSESIGLSISGKVLWTSQQETGGMSSEHRALPAGPDRDLLVKLSWNGLQILDARQNVLIDQSQILRGGKWLFRPAPAGGVEALVIGPDAISCYDLILTNGSAPASSIASSYAERRRQRHLERDAAAPPAAAPVHAASESRIDFYARILDRDPENIEALHWRGFLYAMRGEAKPCRRDFDKAIRLAPKAANIRWSYGWALLNLGDYSAAARQWERMAELDKTVPATADYHLALAYWADGQKESALNIFNAAVARDPVFWISRDHARAYAAKWTEKEKAILFSLYDAWSRLYRPPARAEDYPLPAADRPASEW